MTQPFAFSCTAFFSLSLATPPAPPITPPRATSVNAVFVPEDTLIAPDSVMEISRLIEKSVA
jgi:hypothetical protein